MNFDLNIENYNRNELIDMFQLPSNFDRNIVEIQETKLRDSIFKNKQIDKDTQVKTINFLTKAKTIILNDNTKENPFAKEFISIYNTSYELKQTALEDQGEHMVQVRKEKPYASSYPSEFFPGVINPLRKRTIRKNLNIDTKFRDSYYTTLSTNFNINLPLNIDNVVQMQLSAIEIPTTYFLVSRQYGNNFFTITANNETAIISIPDGNYTETTIIDAINHQISITPSPFPSTSVKFAVNLVSSASGSTGSGQTIVGPAAGPPALAQLELNFQNNESGFEDRSTPLPLKLGWILGFRNGKYEGNLNYVSEGIIDVQAPKYVYLVVDDFNNSVNNNFFSAFNSSILNKNILARISINQNNFSVLEQNNLNLVTTPREYFGPINLYSMNVQLLDEYGRILNLNNMDFSFCLTLVTVYDI
jgi:hypothetical protein